MSQFSANQQLAHAILRAAELREKSFNHALAARLQTEGKPCNFGQLYSLTIRDAAEIDGANPFLSFPVYLLLTNSWNEAIDWARLNV